MGNERVHYLRKIKDKFVSRCHATYPSRNFPIGYSAKELTDMPNGSKIPPERHHAAVTCVACKSLLDPNNYLDQLTRARETRVRIRNERELNNAPGETVNEMIERASKRNNGPDPSLARMLEVMTRFCEHQGTLVIELRDLVSELRIFLK